MRALAIGLIAWWVAGVAAATPPERALGPGASDAAEWRYHVARQLYREGKFRDAARELDVAATMVPDSPKLAYNAARAWERAGEAKTAVARYRRYLELAPQAKDRAAVEQAIALLEAQLPIEPAVWVVESNPIGARVFVDGSTEASGVAPLRLQLEPGTHTVRLEAEAFVTEARTLTLEAGAEARSVVAMTARAEPTPAWMTPTGWSAVGLGVVLAGVSAWLGVEAVSARDEAEALRGEPGRHTGLEDDFEAARAGAYASGGAALLLVGVGTTLLVLAGDDEAPTAGSMRAVPGGVTVSW